MNAHPPVGQASRLPQSAKRPAWRCPGLQAGRLHDYEGSRDGCPTTTARLIAH